MNNLLFDTYSVKGNLKFYKIETDPDALEEEKITINIGISANHQIKANIYEDVSAFLENLLLKDYMNESTHKSQKAHEKALALAEKEQAKREKAQKKLREKAVKAEKAKVPKVKEVKKVKSLY